MTQGEKKLGKQSAKEVTLDRVSRQENEKIQALEPRHRMFRILLMMNESAESPGLRRLRLSAGQYCISTDNSRPASCIFRDAK